MYSTILITLLAVNCALGQDSGTAGNPRGQHCRGFNAEDVRKFNLAQNIFKLPKCSLNLNIQYQDN